MAPVQVYARSPINSHSPSAAAARYTPFEAESRPSSIEPTLLDHENAQPANAAAASMNGRLEPTATLRSSESLASASTPPPPQPGAVPTPFRTSPSIGASMPLTPRPLEIPGVAQLQSFNGSPPKPTQMPQAQTPTHTRPLPAQSPQNFGTVYTPIRSVPPSRATSISTAPSYTYNGSSPSFSYSSPVAPVQDLSHPPGYQQESTSFADKPVESCQETDYRATLSPLSAPRTGAGILDLEWTFGSPNGLNDDNTVVKMAMTWAKAAGKRLSMTEKQIWKTIKGHDDGD